MNKAEATATIREIAEDVFASRGDGANVHTWGPSYTWWREAAEALSAEEVDDAIHEARLFFADDRT